MRTINPQVNAIYPFPNPPISSPKQVAPKHPDIHQKRPHTITTPKWYYATNTFPFLAKTPRRFKLAQKDVANRTPAESNRTAAALPTPMMGLS